MSPSHDAQPTGACVSRSEWCCVSIERAVVMQRLVKPGGVDRQTMHSVDAQRACFGAEGGGESLAVVVRGPTHGGGGESSIAAQAQQAEGERWRAGKRRMEWESATITQEVSGLAGRECREGCMLGGSSEQRREARCGRRLRVQQPGCRSREWNISMWPRA